MNRREFVKSAAMAGATLTLIPSVVLLEGCNVDEVIAGLQVADAADKAAEAVVKTVNPAVANVMGLISTDLELVIKAYGDYETAAPGDKPTKAQLIQATVGTIRGNLSGILAALHVSNPELVAYVTVAVEVVNSALAVVLAKLPQSATRAQSIEIGPALPVVPPTVKTSKDLKAYWNQQAAEKGHAESQIK